MAVTLSSTRNAKKRVLRDVIGSSSTSRAALKQYTLSYQTPHTTPSVAPWASTTNAITLQFIIHI